MAKPPLQPSEPSKIYSLRSVTARIKEILLDVTTKRFWVSAHLVSKKSGSSSGHFYCELVENDDRGLQIAKINAVIWESSLEVINRKLQKAGCQDVLKGNKEICAYCSVDYHEVYGLKLQIHDIDPNFGEAQIDRNRRLILERLKADQLFEKNKAVTLPAAILRIGLITAENSAALNDFTKTLGACSFAFKVIVASASMQGERMEEQVLAALRALVEVGVDAICLVRGGGSQVDLAWFDNERIARAIAAAPVPVWVGIGHEIDFVVLDSVAHTSFKTPTAVAEELVRRIKALDDRLTIADSRLHTLVDRQVTLATRNMRRYVSGLLQGARKHYNQGRSDLQEYLLRIRSGFDSQCGTRKSVLDRRSVQVRERSQSRLAARLERIASAERRLVTTALSRIDNTGLTLGRDAQGLRKGTRKYLELVASQLTLKVFNVRTGIETATTRKRSRVQEQSIRLQNTAMHILKDRARLLDTVIVRVKTRASNEIRTIEDSLNRRMDQFRVSRYEKRLDVLVQVLDSQQNRLESLRPEKMLSRGYSITRDSAGKVLRSIEQIGVGQRLSTQLIDGCVNSAVIQNEEHQDGD